MNTPYCVEPRIWLGAIPQAVSLDGEHPASAHGILGQEFQPAIHARLVARDYKSSGVRPVTLAIRPNMRGPISSLSWNAKTTSGQPGRSSTRWDPVWRIEIHVSVSITTKCSVTTRCNYAAQYWMGSRPPCFVYTISRSGSFYPSRSFPASIPVAWPTGQSADSPTARYALADS